MFAGEITRFLGVFFSSFLQTQGHRGMVSLAAHHEVFGVSLAPFTKHDWGSFYEHHHIARAFLSYTQFHENLKLGDGSNHRNLPHDPSESSLFPHLSY